MAQQQKVLLYVLPLIFAFSGVNFPIGVLIYWTTTNLWSMGQQFYTIRRMPAPGSQAEIAMKERKARKAKAHGVDRGRPRRRSIIEEKPRGQREQPKRKDRNKPRPVIDDDHRTSPSRPTDGDVRRAQHAGARRPHQAKEVAHPRDDDRRENSMTSTQPDAPRRDHQHQAPRGRGRDRRRLPRGAARHRRPRRRHRHRHRPRPRGRGDRVRGPGRQVARAGWPAPTGRSSTLSRS